STRAAARRRCAHSWRRAATSAPAPRTDGRRTPSTPGPYRCDRDSTRPLCHTPTLHQQGREPGLLEMVIARQRLPDASLQHNDERDAISEGPLLVGACVVQRRALLERLLGCGHNLVGRVGAKMGDELFEGTA